MSNAQCLIRKLYNYGSSSLPIFFPTKRKSKESYTTNIKAEIYSIRLQCNKM